MSVFDFSKTAASNVVIEGVSVPVGAMAPSAVGPALRALAAAIAKWRDDFGGAQSTAGSANAYTLTLNMTDAYSGSATFADGQELAFVASFTNTGAATLNVNSEGAKAIRKVTDAGEEDVEAGDITQNGHFKVQYDASANSAAGAWILLLATPVAALTEALLTTRGDIITRGASAAQRLALGTAGKALISDGTDATWYWPYETWVIACSDETTAITATADKAAFQFPYAFTITAVYATLTTAQSTGNIFTVDINESGSTILSTKLTIDNTEKTSATAVAAAVISDASIAANVPVSVDVDQIGDGTAKGLKVTIIGRRT